MKEPTESQWDAIRACDEHILVEAGAGTGKTSTVVARILYLLGAEVRGVVRPEPLTLADIVAITFTRQAAADLKRDLRAALRELGRRADAYEVDQARIGTIHGFCSDLVNEHALRSGRPPVAGVLEEGEALAWTEAALRDELLAALETRSIQGLDSLLTAWTVAKVEGWAIKLMRSAGLLETVKPEGHTAEEQALIELARRALARMEKRLVDEGFVDYDRMIGWTRNLLRDEAGVRSILQRRTHTLIIDEFQDTDPVQREIAYLLAQPGSGRSDTPRLMLVGDPKQSIYRFRGADVTVWSRVRRDFEENGYGRVLRLRDNFRSVPSILSLVEATAGRWLNAPSGVGDGLADYEVAFHPVDPARPEPAAPSVEFLVVPANAEGKAANAAERRRIEAEGIARRLLDLREEGMRWRDVALLLRTWGSLDIYADAMRRAGIPVYALRDDDFLETREVLDLVVALRAIRDPRDDLATLGFLRSPFVSLRDDTLLAIASRTPKRPYIRNLEIESLPEPERVQAGAELLMEMVELRDRMPASELIDELMQRTGYLAHLALRGEAGAQASLNVRRFLRMLDEMEEGTVGQVLRAIGERRAREDRIPQARLHGEQDDVVLITSIHMAKGLDWPVVILGDLGGSGRGDNDRLLVGRTRLRLGDDVSPRDQSDRWTELKTELEMEEKAEAKRVTYVALTRPKDRLILAGIPRGTGVSKDSVAAALLAVFPELSSAASGETVEFRGGDEVARRARVTILRDPHEADEPLDPRYSQVTIDDIELALPPAAITTPAGLTRHSATELLVFGRCQRRHNLKYVLGIVEPKPAPRGGGDAVISAVARGQIVHDVLERFEEDLELEGLLEDAIGRWDEGAPAPETSLGRTYREELSAEIGRVLEMPEYASLADAPGARRELRFLRVLEDGTAMQGAIDLTAPAGDGLTLVDVKTSRISASEVAERAEEYTPQRDVYIAAAARLSPRPVESFRFVFSHPGASADSAIDADEVSRAERRVDDALALMGTVPDALAGDSRECLFCGYRKAGICPGVDAASKPEAASQAG